MDTDRGTELTKALCAGGMVAPSWAVCCATCLKNKNATDIFLLVFGIDGNDNSSVYNVNKADKTQIRIVDSIHRHPKFRSSTVYNVALIKIRGNHSNFHPWAKKIHNDAPGDDSCTAYRFVNKTGQALEIIELNRAIRRQLGGLVQEYHEHTLGNTGVARRNSELTEYILKGEMAQAIAVVDYDATECADKFFPRLKNNKMFHCAVKKDEEEFHNLNAASLGAILVCNTNSHLEDSNGTATPLTTGIFFEVKKIDCLHTPAPYSWLAHKDLRRFARFHIGKQDYKPNLGLASKVKAQPRVMDEIKNGRKGYGSPPSAWVVAAYVYISLRC